MQNDNGLNRLRIKKLKQIGESDQVVKFKQINRCKGHAACPDSGECATIILEYQCSL